MKGSFLLLGTGASAGVPMVGCQCPVCKSQNPKNQRLRQSGLLRAGGKTLLIDTGPDLRLQMLRYGVAAVDGVLLTHTHFDHIAGIDELRAFYLQTREPIPLLLSKTSLTDLKRRYDYLFKEKSWGVSLPAQLHFEVLEGERGEIDFLGLPIFYTTYFQGGMAVNGFRLGDFAYISDIREYPEAIFEELRGVKTLVLSALRESPSFMHLSFQEAGEFAKKVGAEQTVLTHISHVTDHDKPKLLPGCILGYDGLELEFSFDVK